MCVARLFLSLLLCLVAGESGTWNLKIPTCPLAVGDITCLLSSCAPVRLFLLLERKVPRCTVSVSNSLLSSHAFFSSSSSTYSYYYYYYYCYSDSSSLLLSACLLLSSLFFFSTRLTVLALLILLDALCLPQVGGLVLKGMRLSLLALCVLMSSLNKSRGTCGFLVLDCGLECCCS